MSAAISGKVGGWEITWESAPRGESGTAVARVKKGSEAERRVNVSWRRDPDGIWLELPDGVYGFELRGELNDEGRVVYRAVSRLHGAEWAGLSFVRAGEEQAAAGQTGKKKGTRVRAQMPGKIVRVLVKQGDVVEKGQSLLVMEAMKMENEIRAAAAGTVAAVKVSEGQAVESGADLLALE